MNWDTIIVLLVLALAIAYVIRRFLRARKGESCCGSAGGGCSCDQGGISDRNDCHCCPGNKPRKH